MGRPSPAPAAAARPRTTFFLAGTVCLVKSPYHGDPYKGLVEAYEDGSGYVRAVCPTRASAEAHRERLARQWRAHWLTGGYFCLKEMTSLPPALLRDLVLDLGLEPPALEVCGEDSAWTAWWAEAGPRMSDWQRARFLEALDRDGGYWVEEVPVLDRASGRGGRSSTQYAAR
jgi:hypothetical protein